MEGMFVFGSYKLGRKLGSGSFGKIYQATRLETGESVAIKFENISVKHSQLINEAKVMKLLEGKRGIPKIYCAGVEGEYNVMVMEYLGYSLEALFTNCGRKFSLKTTLMIMDQMIGLIRHIHLNLFLHRDIKPDNFLMGVGENEAVVYAIDFGLAKRYRDPKSGCHIMYRTNKSLTGTARYTSINTHLGIEQSRRDDLEGILYSVLYFLRGSLPWQGLPAKNKYEKYAKIKEVKTKTSIEILCKDVPAEIPKMLKYCHSLKFEEDPNYDFFSENISLMMKNCGFEYDYVYDWSTGLPRFDRHCLSQQPPNGTRAQTPHLHNSKSPEERENKAYDSRVSLGQERIKVTEHNSIAAQYTHTLPHIPEPSKKTETTPIVLQDEKEGGEVHKLCCSII